MCGWMSALKGFEVNKLEFQNKAHSCLFQSHDVPDGETVAKAAVLIAIVAREQGLSVFYTQRAPWLKRHAGEVSFPGGRVEGDETFQQTAIREAYEEAMVPMERAETLGFLPSLISISDFRVVPVVALIHGDFEAKPDGQEVTHTFEVPLSTVLDLNVYQAEERNHAGVIRQTYAFTYSGFRIWGLTGLLSQTLAQHFAK